MTCAQILRRAPLSFLVYWCTVAFGWWELLIIQPRYGFDSEVVRGEKWLGILGTRVVEGREIAPLQSVDPPSQLHRNVFAGVAKGFAPASFGEQEEEL